MFGLHGFSIGKKDGRVNDRPFSYGKYALIVFYIQEYIAYNEDIKRRQKEGISLFLWRDSLFFYVFRHYTNIQMY